MLRVPLLLFLAVLCIANVKSGIEIAASAKGQKKPGNGGGNNPVKVRFLHLTNVLTFFHD